MPEIPDAERASAPVRPRPLLHRLAFRLAVALCVGAAVIGLLAGLANVALQREHMTRLVRTSASRAAEIVRQSTRDAMLANNPDEVHRILERIGGQPGIERIRIFDKQGRVITSTAPEEIGKLVDLHAEQCHVCHRENRPLERLDMTERARVFRNGGGVAVLGVIAPIRNEPDCSSAACHVHPASQQVLGVLDLQMPLGEVEAQLEASERQLGLGLAATAAAVLGLSIFLCFRMVLRPVRLLTEATRRVAGGDLETRADVTAPDEIGELTASWNGMVAELSAARGKLEEWNRTLERRVADKTRELTEAHRRMLLVEKMASLGKLAAIVAHEINNPLAGIATYARLLRRRSGSDAEASRALELMETEAARCGDIVRNLLLFSRTPGARFAPTELRPLLLRCALLVRHQAELQGVEVAIDAPEDLPRVACDASQVQQVVLALAMNALEAMPEGGHLTLAAAPEGPDAVALRVADDGCGIAPEHLPHVFEPFYSTKEEGKGVGLGLAVVYGIVERHHGEVGVDSEPGRGTTFTVRLPVRQPEPAAAPPPPPLAGALP